MPDPITRNRPLGVRNTDNDAPVPTTTPAAPFTPSSVADAQRASTLRTLNLPAVVPLSPAEAKDKQIQAKMDAFREAAAGPYKVTLPASHESVLVRAAPQFRMQGGHNQRAADLHRDPKSPENIWGILQKAKLPMPYAMVTSGRATAEQLVKVTQALIDQGYLRSGSRPLEERIRDMQWEFGIGCDCAGYVQNELLSVTGASRETLGLKRTDLEDLSGVPANPNFKKVAPENARPGDILALDKPSPGDVGHRTMVYANKPIDASRATELAKEMGPTCKAFLGGKGPFREIVVEASWGAGRDGNARGGVRRERWIYDADSKSWGCWEPTPSNTAFTFSVTPSPHNEPLMGVFRAKVLG